MTSPAARTASCPTPPRDLLDHIDLQLASPLSVEVVLTRADAEALSLWLHDALGSRPDRGRP